jgi:prolyl oligopeptidase
MTKDQSTGSLFLTTMLVLTGCSDKLPPPTLGAPDYPNTETVDVVDTYHGVDVADPYRWLEDLESIGVNAWVAEQNILAEPFIAELPNLEKVRARVEAATQLPRWGRPVKRGERYFFTYNDGTWDQSVIMVTDDLDSPGTVLLDPNGMRDDATVALAGFEVSPDGKWMAYSVSDGGTDWNTWRVMDVDRREQVPDSIGNTKFTGVSWSADSQGFYYSRYPVDEAGQRNDHAQVAVFYHQLGDAAEKDRLVYQISDHPTRNPYAEVSDDGRYLVFHIQDGFSSNGISYRSLTDDDGKVIRLLDDWDALYSFLGNSGDTFYFFTTRDAPLGRVVAINLSDPAPGQWREVIAEGSETLEAVSFVGGHFVVRYLADVVSRVLVFDDHGRAVVELALPGLGSVFGFEGKATEKETFFTYQDFATPPTVYRYPVGAPAGERYRGPDSVANYETRQVFVTSKDSTRFPMFIVGPEDLKPTGDLPVLLYGYGGFNVSNTPAYDSIRRAWLDLGGVFVSANIRGGGEYGAQWHEAGTRLNKQNVFDDFIAAAEWLIEEGYTTPARLAIRGRSNGGLLVGAVMTQRPELFGAALPAVGVLDMLRYHTASANARAWSSDYGLSEDAAEFAAQYAYSPYHNVIPACYPPTLVTTADRDDRVVPWHSYKFAARLQAAQFCTNPIMLRVETRAGHRAGKPQWMVVEDYTAKLAFAAWALKMDL